MNMLLQRVLGCLVRVGNIAVLGSKGTVYRFGDGSGIQFTL